MIDIGKDLQNAFDDGYAQGRFDEKVETEMSLPKWIPCSERLPRYDETSEYLVTDKDGRIRHCCLDPYMPETFVTVEEGMIVDAVAWRQAPEPYEGGGA